MGVTSHFFRVENASLSKFEADLTKDYLTNKELIYHKYFMSNITIWFSVSFSHVAVTSKCKSL